MFLLSPKPSKHPYNVLTSGHPCFKQSRQQDELLGVLHTRKSSFLNAAPGPHLSETIAVPVQAYYADNSVAHPLIFYSIINNSYGTL